MPQAVAEVTSALGRSSQRREEIWARARQQGLGAGGPQDDAAGTSLDEQLLRMSMQVRLAYLWREHQVHAAHRSTAERLQLPRSPTT